MDLWHRSNGEVPHPLPEMALDPLGQPWTNLRNNPEGRNSTGYILAPEYPEYNPETQRPVWNAISLNWDLAAVVPPVVEEPVVPLRVTKMDFSRLFTNEERGALYIAEKTLSEMSASDLTILENVGWVYLGIILKNFDLPAEYIELDNADVISALYNVLVPMGILTTLRAEQILANEPPV